MIVAKMKFEMNKNFIKLKNQPATGFLLKSSFGNLPKIYKKT